MFNENINDGNIGLRYSREERLKQAPEAVRQMHDENFIPRPGLIGSLTATKGSRSILFVLILVLLLMLVSLVLPSDTRSGKVLGVPVAIQALTQGSALYVSTIFDKATETAYHNLPVSVYAAVFDSQKKILASKTVETIYLGNKSTIPFTFTVANAARLDVFVIINGKELHLHTKL